tara:strand:- start:68 stop:319 length:252 start_codon:yes stop_codon:yes gene_type:complete
VLKKITIPFFFLLSCNGVNNGINNMDIKDQNGKKHFYNRILHFNEDSTMLWCYNHEQFEVVKKDTNRTMYKDWNDIASDWILY